MVLEERPPCLRWWFRATRHKPRHAALRDVEPELQQFSVDAWRTQERVRQRHGTHEIRKLRADPWSAHSPAAGLPSPESAKALPMPANYRLRFYDMEHFAPPCPPLREPHPEGAIE